MILTKLQIFISMLLLLFCAALVLAAPPRTINYQGYLTSSSGVPVSSPEKAMGFTLYSTASGSTPFWSERQTVRVTNGIYNVELGSATPLNLPGDIRYFLGVTVPPDPEMMPRQELTGVPYALRAGCTPGDMLSCYSGPAGTLGIGECKSGIRTCGADGAAFGPCVGEVVPRGEIVDNKDNDCNGLIDDNALLCYPGESYPCGSSVGACRSGSAICNATGTGYGPCVGAVGPTTEICDGIDNDCNGRIDLDISYPSPINGTYDCIDAHQYFFCNLGYASCTASGACEVNTTNDPLNCGGCGVVCNFANANANCLNGVCSIGMCNPGFADCDRNLANGCEVNTQSDVNNCGACGVVCPTVAKGTTSCQAGVCKISTCSGGFANCDGMVANGCEVNTNFDPNNCGACATVCPAVPNGTRGCNAGFCGIGSCNTGFANCNMASVDGCETNTTIDLNNCGACGSVCPAVANGTSVCSRGICGVGTCNPGFANCDAFPGNGCEINLQFDFKNCGSCGIVCPSGVCSSGVCRSAQGAACISGTECASGFCTDGVCCESACGGLCEKCNLAGSSGLCAPVPAGTDPDKECLLACNGSRNCQ
jgi:hypothetical protein